MTASVLALIPARAGSKGIPGKNTRRLGGVTLMDHAVNCGQAAGCVTVLTTDMVSHPSVTGLNGGPLHYLLVRPAELAQDDTPMFAVVQHALAQIPGPAEQIVVLLQPTQPFRTPEHVRKAITMLEKSGANSVVSVVPLPLTHSPELICLIDHSGISELASRLLPFPVLEGACGVRFHLGYQPARRQDVQSVYKRDGTVYAFRRSTVDLYGNIYGQHVCPLLLDPAETCELDSEADWAAVEARWAALHQPAAPAITDDMRRRWHEMDSY